MDVKISHKKYAGKLLTIPEIGFSVQLHLPRDKSQIKLSIEQGEAGKIVEFQNYTDPDKVATRFSLLHLSGSKLTIIYVGGTQLELGVPLDPDQLYAELNNMYSSYIHESPINV